MYLNQNQNEKICLEIRLAINVIPYGLVVRILAFHAGGPGSIPGVGRFFFTFKKNILLHQF